MKNERIYLSYLLRLWQVNRDGKRVWWASLEKPGTHEQHSFTCLDDLFAFLKKQTETIENQESEEDIKN